MSAFNKNAWYRQLVGIVSPRAFTIGYVLVEHYLFRDKDECWSSQENLGRLANASSRTVRDALKELEDAGFLTHRRGGKGHANRYIPHFVDRQNLAGQKATEEGHERQNFACDDRQSFAAEYTEQQLKVEGPLAGPLHNNAATSFNVLEEGSPIAPPMPPEGGVGEIVDPSDVAIDAMEDFSSCGDPSSDEAEWTDDQEDDESTLEERLADLRETVTLLAEDRVRLPDVLQDVLDDENEVSEEDLEILEALADDIRMAESERLDAANAEIEAARAAVAARTVATLVIAPSAPMTFHVDHMAVAAVTLSTFTPVGLGDLKRIRPGAQRFLSQGIRRRAQKQQRATDSAAELCVDFTFPEPNRGTHHG